MEVIKQILRKGEEMLRGRKKKGPFKEVIVNAEALENRVAVLEDGGPVHEHIGDAGGVVVGVGVGPLVLP